MYRHSSSSERENPLATFLSFSTGVYSFFNNTKGPGLTLSHLLSSPNNAEKILACANNKSRAPRDFFFNQKRIDTKDFNFKVDFEFGLKGLRAALI